MLNEDALVGRVGMHRLLELCMCATYLVDLGVEHAIWIAIEALVSAPGVLLCMEAFLWAIRNSWHLLDYQVVFKAIDVSHSRLSERSKLVEYLAHDIYFSEK